MTSPNILFVVPLNEAYERIVSAAKTPWKSKQGTGGKIAKVDCVYPSGVLSISAYLKKHVPEANIKILDLNAAINHLAKTTVDDFGDLAFEPFLEASCAFLNDFRPDFIGISALFVNVYKDLKPLVAFLKARYPEALLTCGGHVPSALYRRIFDDGIAVDAIAFGEGEIPCVDLVRAMADARNVNLGGGAQNGTCRWATACLESHPSWITRNKLQRELLFEPENKLLMDLDDIPVYDLDVLAFPDAYFTSTNYFFAIDARSAQREMVFFTTRGCPFNCVFCASQNVHGHKVRFYSVDRLKQDVEYYNKRYGITRFVCYDDHILVDKARAVEILNFVGRQGFAAEIPTPPFFAIDRNVADAMQRAGIKEVNLIVESGNEETLRKIMRKPSKLASLKPVTDLLHERGITVIANILIGLPGETKESIEIGFENLKKMDINWFQCFVTAPLPGSDLYRICEENGYFATDDDPVTTMDFKRCVIRTPDFEPEYIEKKCYEMNLTLNFVNNYDMRIGNEAAALLLFERVLHSVTAHAFAHYFAAQCCRKIGLTEKYATYKAAYDDSIAKYPFWADHAKQYQLPPLE